MFVQYKPLIKTVSSRCLIGSSSATSSMLKRLWKCIINEADASIGSFSAHFKSYHTKFPPQLFTGCFIREQEFYLFFYCHFEFLCLILSKNTGHRVRFWSLREEAALASHTLPSLRCNQVEREVAARILLCTSVEDRPPCSFQLGSTTRSHDRRGPIKSDWSVRSATPVQCEPGRLNREPTTFFINLHADQKT